MARGVPPRAGGRIRTTKRALLALLLLLLAGPTSAQRIRGDTIEVLSLEFDGAEQFGDELLRSAIMTAPTRCASVALQPICWLGVSLDRHYLDERALRADSARLWYFYHQRGYREAKVSIDTARVPGGVHVTFRIAEGRPVLVNSIIVEVPPELSSGLSRNLPLRQGRPFSELEFATTGDTLEARIANRGHAGELESSTLKWQSQEHESFVMATGGGAPCFLDGMSVINAAGVSIFLHVSLDELLSRNEMHKHRPLLQGDAKEKLKELYHARLTIYNQANHVIEGDSISSADIIHILNAKK
jgi:shikimate kinase